jgi:hypothetical protein
MLLQSVLSPQVIGGKLIPEISTVDVTTIDWRN